MDITRICYIFPSCCLDGLRDEQICMSHMPQKHACFFFELLWLLVKTQDTSKSMRAGICVCACVYTYREKQASCFVLFQCKKYRYALVCLFLLVAYEDHEGQSRFHRCVIQSGKEELSVSIFSINLESRYHRGGLRIIKKWASVQLPVMLSYLIPLTQINLYEVKCWNKMLA